MNRKQADFKELEQIYAKNGNQLIVLWKKGLQEGRTSS